MTPPPPPPALPWSWFRASRWFGYGCAACWVVAVGAQCVALGSAIERQDWTDVAARAASAIVFLSVAVMFGIHEQLRRQARALPTIVAAFIYSHKAIATTDEERALIDSLARHLERFGDVQTPIVNVEIEVHNKPPPAVH